MVGKDLVVIVGTSLNDCQRHRELLGIAVTTKLKYIIAGMADGADFKGWQCRQSNLHYTEHYQSELKRAQQIVNVHTAAVNRCRVPEE